MQKHLVFFVFLLFLGGISSLCLSLRFVSACLDYFPLSAVVSASISRWEVLEMHGKFAIKATYSFEWQERVWKGSTVLAQAGYLNEGAAIAALKEKAKHPWRAFFNPRHPAQSSLEKEFPIGLLLRTLVCYGVFIYFIIIFKKRIAAGFD